MNSILDWNDNLAAIFEAKLTLNRPSSSALPIVFSSNAQFILISEVILWFFKFITLFSIQTFLKKSK